MSTTPRTDAAVKLTIGVGFNSVCPNFARTLERELASMTARAEKAEAALDSMTTELGKMFLSASERADRNFELRRRADKAEADTARLDWLSVTRDVMLYYPKKVSSFTPETFRAAIDAAMTKETSK